VTVLRRILGATLVSAALLLGSATPAHAAARIVFYDASRAAEFVSAVNQGAANWNARVSNVQLRAVPPGGRADVVVTAANGWPFAVTQGLGRGEISFGRDAVNQGHFPPRIAAHEFGHILGLPDNRTGVCADLMSGGSAPPTCRNAFPNPQEAARVQSNFRAFAPPARTDAPALVFTEK
jgi:snapalysin